MEHRIVVAIGGSTSSEGAVRWATRRARTIDAEIDITTVLPLRGALLRAGDVPEPPAPQPVLEALRDLRAALPAAHITTSIRHGDPVDELALDASRSDLIAIGLDSGARGILHHHLVARLARRVGRPVVAVPSSWTHSDQRVVVGIDGESDSAALQFGIAEATALGGSLQLVHAWSVPTGMDLVVSGRRAPPTSHYEYHHELLDRAVEYAREQAPQLSVTGMLQQAPVGELLESMAEGAHVVAVGCPEGGHAPWLRADSEWRELQTRTSAPIALCAATRASGSVAPVTSAPRAA